MSNKKRKYSWGLFAAWVALAVMLLVLSIKASAQGGFDFVTVMRGDSVAVTCDSRNLYDYCSPDSTDPACVHLRFNVPRANWAEFVGLMSRGDPLNLWPMIPASGQVLQGMWGAGGQFKTVASCEVRAQRTREAQCREAGYDCARWSVNRTGVGPYCPRSAQSKFITELVTASKLKRGLARIRHGSAQKTMKSKRYEVVGRNLWDGN